MAILVFLVLLLVGHSPAQDTPKPTFHVTSVRAEDAKDSCPDPTACTATRSCGQSVFCDDGGASWRQVATMAAAADAW